MEEKIYRFIRLVTHSPENHYFVMTQEEQMWVFKQLNQEDFIIYQNGQALFYEEILVYLNIPKGNLLLSVALIYNSVAHSLPFFFPEELEETAQAKAISLSHYLASLGDIKE